MNKKKRVLPIVAVMLLISTMLLATASATTDADATAQAAEDQPPDPPERHPDLIRASRSDSDRNMFLMETESQSIAPTTTIPPTPTTTKVPKPKPAKPAKPTQPPAKTKTTTTTTPTLASSGGNQTVVAVALAQVGKSYRSGGTGPDSFDCSGLVFYVLNQAGVSVPRLTSDGYYARYSKITRNNLQPGDLLVSSGHIGIYIGGGQMVHASTPRGGVKRASMDAPKPFGFVRVSSLP